MGAPVAAADDGSGDLQPIVAGLPRAALPPTAEEEYYHADLIGLEARLADGSMLGQVCAVHDFGAGDTLEIVRPAGPPSEVRDLALHHILYAENAILLRYARNS